MNTSNAAPAERTSNNTQNSAPSVLDRNLTQFVYLKIREMMFNYEISPGQRITFNELAQKLNVSRTPVNNALSILAYEGFMDFIPHQGYRAHQITLEEAESLYEIRYMLELGAAAKIVRNIDDTKLAMIQKHMHHYREAVLEQVSRNRFFLDQEFHAAYMGVTENIYLAEYFREVYQRICLRHRIEGLLQERSKQVVVEHDRIFEAIAFRDAEGLKGTIKDHIEAGKKYIFSIVFR
jgi:DNA-binding GntR family transcriptional regulator